MRFPLIFIIFLIIALSKNAGGGSTTSNYPHQAKDLPQQSRKNMRPQNKTTGFVQPSNPQVRQQIFTVGSKNYGDMSVSAKSSRYPQKNTDKRKKDTSFFNSDFDDYSSVSPHSPKTDYVSGYDRHYSEGSSARKFNLSMQYSHTYDGHEPWDDCLPKEKDPWDKDFYVD